MKKAYLAIPPILITYKIYSMKKNDLKVLLRINDNVIAEDIQGILEASGIYTMLVSDNPASSVLNAYMGSNPMENITIQINEIDYQKAVEILRDSPYEELLTNL